MPRILLFFKRSFYWLIHVAVGAAVGVVRQYSLLTSSWRPQTPRSHKWRAGSHRTPSQSQALPDSGEKKGMLARSARAVSCQFKAACAIGRSRFVRSAEEPQAALKGRNRSGPVN